MVTKNATFHNVRFYKPENRAIHCMCLQKQTRELALSRSDQSVEIWNVAHTPYLQKWIPGSPNSSVEDLKWCGAMLLSCGLQGTVVEYDLISENIKSSTSVTGGVAWCLDYCPKNNLLAVGTEDGFINIFTVTEDELEFFKFLDKQQGRVLCMCWDASGQHLVTGSTDIVRVWSLATGHAIHKLTTGRSQTNRETVVWSLAVTRDLLVISGDSRGIVTFWDGKIGTQVESFHSHDADVLSVALSEDEGSLYCAGVDPLIVLFGRVTDRAGAKRQWARGMVRRIHDHDVRALAVLGNAGLFSGGVDGYLGFSSYPPKTRIRFPPLLKGRRIQALPQQKFLLLRYLDHVELWKLGAAVGSSAELGAPLPLSSSPGNILRINAKPGESIVCAGASQDGRFIAFSTATALKFFSLNLEESAVSKMSGTTECTPCKLLTFFSSRNRQLCAVVTQNNEVRILLVSNDGPEEIHRFVPSATSCITDCISHMVASDGGDAIALADCSSHICVWSTNSWSVLATLPTYDAVPTAVAFAPDSSALLVAYSDHKLVEYDLKKQQYTDFSRRIQNQLSKVCHSTISNIVFDPRQPGSVIAHDDAVLCAMLKDQVLDGVKPSKVRKSEVSSPIEEAVQNDYNAIKAFKHIVSADWLEGDELVIVEVPPTHLSENLPPILSQKKFAR